MRAGEYVLIRIGTEGRLGVEHRISGQDTANLGGGPAWAKKVIEGISPGKFVLVYVTAEFDSVYTSKVTGEVVAQ